MADISAVATLQTRLPQPWAQGVDVSVDDFLTQTHMLVYDDPQLVLSICEQGLVQARVNGDEAGVLRACLRISTVKHALGEDSWREELNEVERQARLLGDDLLLLRVLMAQQSCRIHGCECAESLVICEAALPLALALGHEDLICRILGNGANSLGSIGEYGLALEFYQEMRRHLSPSNSMAFWLLVVASGNEADIHLDMARALSAANDTVMAKEHLTQAVTLAQESCEQCLQAGWSFYDPLHTLVSALLELGEVQKARAWLDRLQASNLPEPAPGSRDEAALELTHALVELREDRAPLSRTLARLRVSEQQPHSAFRDGDYGCQVLRCLSEVLERMGDSEQALVCFRQFVDRQARVQSTVARERAKLMRRTLMMLRGETEEFITHDLRNPLGAALVQLQSLQRSSKVQASLQKGLETAIHNIRRSLDIADHHLMMTRAENLSRDVLGTLDLAGLTDDVCEQMSGPTTAQVHLDREIEFNIPIQGDRKLLMHSLSNLLSNAFKYAPPHSTVRVRLARQPDGLEACLSVSDQGPGLSASMRTRFFQRFAGTVNARPQGELQGLGLALVARTARLHGARIAVHALPDHGTTVSLFFALNK